MKENRTSRIEVRFTPSEKKRIERMAKPYGSISKFILCAVLSDLKVIVEPKEFFKGMKELSTEVNRVGNNINQIARFINTTKDINSYELMREWLDIFSDYNRILNRVDLHYEEILRKMFL